MDVHEDQVGLWVAVQPFYGFIHAVTVRHHLDVLINGLEFFDHILKGRLFVLYNKHFHAIEIYDLKVLPKVCFFITVHL